jgi:hypothetical protein
MRMVVSMRAMLVLCLVIMGHRMPFLVGLPGKTCVALSDHVGRQPDDATAKHQPGRVDLKAEDGDPTQQCHPYRYPIEQRRYLLKQRQKSRD